MLPNAVKGCDTHHRALHRSHFSELDFDAALGAVLNAYMGQWEPGQDIRGVKLLRKLDIVIIVNLVKSILYVNLYLLGVFLIYKEWRQGKFRNPQPEHPQEL